MKKLKSSFLLLISLFTFTQICGQSKLHDIWVLKRLNGKNLAKETPAPSMELNLSRMEIMGNDGCNSYQGEITSLDDRKIAFGGNLMMTEIGCSTYHIDKEYYKALYQARTYEVKGGILILMDEGKNEVLAFFKID